MKQCLDSVTSKLICNYCCFNNGMYWKILVKQVLVCVLDMFEFIAAEYHAIIFTRFAAVFDCPYIWFSSLEPHWMVLRLIDEMPNPAYVSDSASNNAPPLSFKERIEELVNQLHGFWLHSL